MKLDHVITQVHVPYNRQYLLDTVRRIQHWPSYTQDRGKTFFSTHKDIYFPVNVEAIKIKNLLTRSTTFSFSWVPPKEETGWHTDFNRGCTLILPLDDADHLISFDIDGNHYDYYYNSPVITNAKSWHNGINYTDQDRLNLLFHFDYDYDYIKQLDKNDELVTKWTQDYNICLTFDFPMLQEYYNTHSNIADAEVVITNIPLPNCNKFQIVVWDKDLKLDFASVIQHDEQTLPIDIVNAVKFVLDNPNRIQSIRLGK